MKKIGVIKLFAIMAMLLSSLSSAWAQSITIPDFEIEPGQTQTESVGIAYEGQMLPYKGVQFDISGLPAGITIDYENIAPQGALSTFQKRGQNVGSDARIMVFTSGDAVTQTDDIIRLSFKADETVTPGTYDITVKGVKFSDPFGKDFSGGDTTFSITVPAPGLSIYLNDFTIKADGTAVQPIYIRQVDPAVTYMGFQFDIQLPEYLSITNVTALNGYFIKFDALQDKPGYIRVMAYGAASSATDNLLELTFACDATAPVGETVPLTVTNQKFSSTLGTDIPADDSQFNVTIEEAEVKSLTIYMDDFYMSAGGTATQTVLINPGTDPENPGQLQDMIQYQGFQFDLTLPECLSIDIEKCAVQSALNGWGLEVRLIDATANVYRVMVSGQSSNKSNATADLLDLVFKCAEGTSPGKVTYTITNQIFSTGLGQDIKAGESTTTVTITEELIIELDKTTLAILKGNEGQLTATVINNIDNQSVTWSIEPATGVATIVPSADGTTLTITGVAPGTAVIKAECGGKTAECQLTVWTFAVEPTSQTVAVGDDFTITAKIEPDGFNPGTITWTSADDDVATVTDGTVTGVAPGKTTVTAECGEATAACEVTVWQFTIDPTTKAIPVEGEFTITATVLPADLTDKNITWTSSDPTIASVGTDGKVMGLKAGKATISATCNGKTLTCEVTVWWFTISPESKTIKKGESFDITVTWAPEGYEGQEITWSSDKPGVATVVDGKVTGIATGTAIISATAGDMTLNCTVTVIQPAESITLNPTEKTINVNESFEITATINPADATDTEISWSSSDANVATVTVGPDGKVTVVGVKAGTATITATIGTGDNAVTATCVVTVIQPAMSITINPEKSVVAVGGTTGIITATVNPADTSDKTIVWSAQPEGLVTINDLGDGTITVTAGTQTGTVTITATCGNVSATCTVEVTDELAISLDKDELTLIAGESEQLVPTVVNNHDNLPVSWESSNPDVATVDQDGNVTSIKPGTTTITVKCGNVSATCEVTVIPDLRLNAYDIEVYVGDNFQLIATVSPETTEAVTWTIQDTAVATISSTGLVVGVSVGETTATASIQGATVQCKVKVIYAPLEGIVITPAEITLPIGGEADLTVKAEPDNAEVPDGLTWKSSDDSVVTVDENGHVKAVGVGTATITVTTEDGQTATSTITVVAIEAEQIKLNASDVEIFVKETFELKATVLPENTTDKTVTWKSSDDKIATVDANGVVTGVAPGVVAVTATCGSVSATCKVTVKPIRASSVTVNPTEMELTEGETGQITAEIQPDDVTDPTIKWESSDPTVATVDENGNVTAVGEGECDITATVDGETATCHVTVLPYNPYNPDDIKITFSEPFETTVESGTQVDMWVKGEGGNPDGWTYEWTLEGSPNTVTNESALSVTPYNDTDEVITLVYNVTVTNSFQDSVLKEETGTYTIHVWKKASIVDTPMGDGWTGNDNGAYVSAVKIREGNKLGLAVSEANGGYDNDWRYLWTDEAGNELGTEDEIWIRAELKASVAAAAGNDKAISDNIYKVNVTNDGPEGQVWYQQTLQTTDVAVYKRPQAPTQLLRKGDGTSCTFVVMMTPLNNQQILDLGYTYVYGYTDKDGKMTVLASTPELRYTHTDSKTYNDSSLRFWAYSVWHYSDGSVVTSGLRYLDGSEDYDFDASSFSGSRGDDADINGINGINADEDIQGVYTVDGRYLGTDLRQLEHGIYIIITNNSAKKIKL